MAVMTMTLPLTLMVALLIGCSIALDHKPTRQPMSMTRVSKRDVWDAGWMAYTDSKGNYTYYSVEWDVPSYPTNTLGPVLYFKSSAYDVTDTAMLNVALSFFDAQDGTGGWEIWAVHWPFYGEGYLESPKVKVNPGDKIRAVIELVTPTNMWSLSAYVNGAQKTVLTVRNTPGVYIEFPLKRNFVVATTTDAAVQNYLTVLPYNSNKTAGRLFTFNTTDGTIFLTANPSLVLEVAAGSPQGARVLTYQKKVTPTLNQQWVLRDGIIFSMIEGGVKYALTVTSDNKVVISMFDLQKPFLGYLPTPTNPEPSWFTGIGSVQYALEVYSVSDCAQYPPTNRFDVDNVLLKRGAQQVVPKWTTFNKGSQCQVAISVPAATPCSASPAPSAATIAWDSTVVVGAQW